MNKETNKKLLTFTCIFTIIFVILYFLAPIVLTMKSFSGIYFSDETGVIGDTVGGINGPIIAFLGVLVTFYAFYIQYEANKEQKEQFYKQDNDLKIERFENRFFELIRIHRENVTEISISGTGGTVKSRKAILSMFNEFRIIYHVTHKIVKSSKSSLIDKDMVNIAFVLFYVGIGSNSDKLSYELLSKYEITMIENIIQKLSELKNTNKKNTGKKNNRKYYRIKIDKFNELPEIDISFKYKPFSGHIANLGHYFRHIWTTIKYLETQDDEIIKNKYEYIKIFRAQISSYEQLLMHYNALTDLGSAWLKDDLLIKYKLTKNIPIPMAYFGPKLKDIYIENDYFEWAEYIDMKNH